MEMEANNQSATEPSGGDLPDYNDLLRRIWIDFPALQSRRDIVDQTWERDTDFPRADWTI